MRRTRAAGPVLAILLGGGVAIAQDVSEIPPTPSPAATGEASADLQMKRSEDMVVTATRSERPAGEVPVSVTLVDREALESAPSRTLDDALRTIPGLNLPLGNSNLIQPTTNNVSMRGLGGSRVLVLLDGVPQNDGAGGHIHWNNMPLQSVDRVEVVRGAAASLFGNYAMGGVVSVFTRPLEPGRVEADGSFGSFDTTRLSASVTDALGAGLSLGVFGDYENTGGYNRTPPADRGAVDIPSSSRTQNLMTKLDYKGASGLETFLKGTVVDQEMGQGTPLSNNRQRNYAVAAGGSLPLGDSTLAASAFYQQTNYTLWGTTLVPGSGRDKEYQSSYSEEPGSDVGGSAQWSKPMTGFLKFVTSGLDVRNVSTTVDTEARNVAGQVTGTRESHGHQLIGGVFGEASLLPDPRVEILVSARLDAWWNTEGREETSAAGVTAYPDKSATSFDPRLSLRWDLGDGVALRGAAYRAFHAPSLRDLYRGSTQRSLQIVPNPGLGPETLVGGDVGVDLRAGIFSGQVNLFTNQVDGLVARATLATTPIVVVQPKNLGSARSRGVEMMGTFTPAKSVSLDVGYTYTDSVVSDNPANPALVGNEIPGVPKHAGSLSLGWTPPWGLALTFRGRAESQRYGDDANLQATDKFLVLDLFASYPITRTLVIFASGENLLDRQYVNDVNIGRRLGQPRAVFVGLRLRQPIPRLGSGTPTPR